MTIQTTTAKAFYNADGVTTTFPFIYPFQDSTWLLVITRDVNGIETVKTLNSDYTVTGAGSDSGGTVIFSVAPVIGLQVLIARVNVPQTQLTDYTNNGPFPAQTHEDALDKLTYISQELQEQANRSVKLPISDTGTATLPSLALRRNKVLYTDTNGNIGAIGGAPNTVIAWNESGLPVNQVLPTGTPIGTFLQSGTGAVERLYQNKAREIVSVKDFGAVGDGIANDTVAIQFALSLGAKKVLIPAGNYLVDTIAITDNTEIVGDGNGTVFIQNNITAGNGLVYVDSGSSSTQISNIRISNLKFKGKVATGGFSQFVHLISLNGVKNVSIDSCNIEGFQGDGIYLGSSSTAGIERHNTNIKITNCLIDGINNDNRNGISVIDCDGLVVDRCTFKNCTRSNMPGSIDIEPDSYLYHVVRNIRITNNNFSNCLGNVAHIGLVFGQLFTTPPTGFIISNNNFDSNYAVGLVFTQGAVTFNHNIILSNNIVTNGGLTNAGTSTTSYINGITVTGNTVNQSSTNPNAMLLGFDALSFVKNAIIANNIFRVNPSVTTVSGIVIRSCDNVIIKNNIFDGHVSYSITVGAGTSTCSRVNILDNSFTNLVSNIAVTMAAGTPNPSTNKFLNNQLNGASHTFKAFICDDPGTIVNSTTATTFNTANLPDSFPIGTSTAIINGDTGVPIGTQGTLYTFKPVITSGLESWTYQTFYHRNTGTKIGSYFIRKRSSGTNTWTSWYEMVGV